MKYCSRCKYLDIQESYNKWYNVYEFEFRCLINNKMINRQKRKTIHLNLDDENMKCILSEEDIENYRIKKMKYIDGMYGWIE